MNDEAHVVGFLLGGIIAVGITLTLSISSHRSQAIEWGCAYYDPLTSHYTEKETCDAIGIPTPNLP